MTRSLACLFALALSAACAPAAPVDEVFFVRSGGADMPVWVRGEPSSGLALVVIAGGPGGPGMFYADEPAFHRLEAKALVAYWDQRASGGTSGDVAPESLTLAQYTTDLDGVVQALERRYQQPRVVLLGHSFGGLVGHAYLAEPRRRERVAGWIDVDGVHAFAKVLTLERAWAIEALRARLDAGQAVERSRADLTWLEEHPEPACSSLPRLGEVLGTLNTWPTNAAFGTGSAWLNLATPFEGFPTLWNLARATREATTDGTALCTTLLTDLSGALGQVDTPSLVIWGRRDLMPVAHGEEAHRLLGAPAAQKSLVVLEDAGHVPHADQPAAFVEAVEAFTAPWRR